MKFKLFVGGLMVTTCLVCSKVYGGEGPETVTTTITKPPTFIEETVTIDIPATMGTPDSYFTQRGCQPWSFTRLIAGTDGTPGSTETTTRVVEVAGETETQIKIVDPMKPLPPDVIETPLPETPICSMCDGEDDPIDDVDEPETEDLPIDAIVANLGLLVLGLIAIAFMAKSRGLRDG